MKRIVADAGPILHLYEAHALHLFPLIGTVACPTEVLAEVRVHAQALWTGGLPAWLQVPNLSSTTRQQAIQWQQGGLLQAGEAVALAVASEIHPDWFLTDDAAARLMAGSLGIEQSDRPTPSRDVPNGLGELVSVALICRSCSCENRARQHLPSVTDRRNESVARLSPHLRAKDSFLQVK